MSKPSNRAIAAPRWQTALAAHYLTAAAIAWATAGIAAMWLYAPRVPYADQWRHYASLLVRPVAAAVSADNGHFEILPNLLRLADLQLLGGGETLQVCVGIALATGALWLLLTIVCGDRESTPVVRAAAAFSVVFGIFWLGNARALGHAGDSVHVYAVVLCLIAAVRLVLHNAPTGNRPYANWLAILLCALASFSFGSGIASFPALFMLLLVQRSPRTPLLALAAGAAATASVYLVLTAGSEPVPRAELHPLGTLLITLQALGAPFVYLLWPLLDPAAAAAVPGPLAVFAQGAASFWTAHVGPIRRSIFPQAAVGAAVLGAACWMTWQCRRTAASRSTGLGIALAWFGIGCAVLIALSRRVYFASYPEQVYALRYLPWSSLCWSGLLLAAVTRARTERLGVAVVLLLPLLALPSEIGMAQLMRRVQDVAEDTALDATVGVLPADQVLGESDLDDLRAAIPVLRDSHVATFAWPETTVLAQPIPSGATPLAATSVQTEPIVNRLSGTGARVSGRLSPAPCVQRVLVAADGRVIGLLRRTRANEWSGVAAGQSSSAEMQFFEVCR